MLIHFEEVHLADGYDMLLSATDVSTAQKYKIFYI